MEEMEILIALVSIFGIVGTLLNCSLKFKQSFIIWMFTNFGWILITIYTGGSIFTLAMWVVYFVSAIYGLYMLKRNARNNDKV